MHLFQMFDQQSKDNMTNGEQNVVPSESTIEEQNVVSSKSIIGVQNVVPLNQQLGSKMLFH